METQDTKVCVDFELCCVHEDSGLCSRMSSVTHRHGSQMLLLFLAMLEWTRANSTGPEATGQLHRRPDATRSMPSLGLPHAPDNERRSAAVCPIQKGRYNRTCMDAALDQVVLVRHADSSPSQLESFIISGSGSRFEERQRKQRQLMARGGATAVTIAFTVYDGIISSPENILLKRTAQLRTPHGGMNYLTHLAVARTIMRANLSMGLVVEDDAQGLLAPAGLPSLITDVVNLAQRAGSFDLMFVGGCNGQHAGDRWNETSRVSNSSVAGGLLLRALRMPRTCPPIICQHRCGHAYLLSSRGARRWLERGLYATSDIDSHFSEMHRMQIMEIDYVEPPLLCQRDGHSRSVSGLKAIRHCCNLNRLRAVGGWDGREPNSTECPRAAYKLASSAYTRDQSSV